MQPEIICMLIVIWGACTHATHASGILLKVVTMDNLNGENLYSAFEQDITKEILAITNANAISSAGMKEYRPI